MSCIVNESGNCRPGLEVHEADGVAFLANRVYDIQSGAAPYFDFLFLDVFDGDDLIPDEFTQAGQAQPAQSNNRSACSGGPYLSCVFQLSKQIPVSDAEMVLC